MCYLVTGINANLTSQAARNHGIYDTEEEARLEAEKLVKTGYNEVSVWKQIATPKVETTVIWSQADA